MSRGAGILVVLSGLVLVVFGAGFFAPGKASMGCRGPEPCATRSPAERPSEAGFYVARNEKEDPAHRVVWATAGPASPSKPGGLLGLTASPNYKRAPELSLKVEDCTKAEDALEARLEAIKGEILDMLMEGTEGSRTRTLSVLIPADKFREFVADLRKMGKVQAEKITASKLKPGEAKGESKETPDPRELSLVAIRLADEKVAQTVLESRGLLASSFDQSASHFMSGLAVLVEALGYVLPYFIVLMALILPVAIFAKVRRSRQAAM